MPDNTTSENSVTALGFDYGLKHIGVAVGQSLTASATALDILTARGGVPNWDEVATLIEKWRPDVLVVGIPLNMDGTPNPITEKAQRFANRLHGRYNLTVHEVDERLTTVEAKQQSFDKGGYKQLKSGRQDSNAAKIILEDWLRQC